MKTVRCVIAIIVCAAATAHAQAPGAVISIAAPDPVMSDRWAAGVSLGSETLTPRIDGAAGARFGFLELAMRYRIVPRLELAIALLAGGDSGDQLAMAGIYVTARYRFLPRQPWNWFLLGGVGVASVAASDATNPDKQGRGSIHVGVGGERRFHDNLAIEAELRIIGVAHDSDVPEPQQTSQDYQVARFGLSGGSLQIGASYYF